MILLLDTGILGSLCHPRQESHQPVKTWLSNLMQRRERSLRVFLPEIADYELRRKLIHLISINQASRKSLQRLNDLADLLDYLPLSTLAMRQAADFWAQARRLGLPTSSDSSLDGDVILAAQAFLIDGTVVTGNRKHIDRFVPARDWPEINPD